MAWFILVIAGFLEVAWALGLKFTEGFSRPVPSLLTGGAIVASMYLLAVATRELPIGSSYAIWVGIGIVGSTIGGALLFGEPMNAMRIGFTLLLIVSIVGLRVSS